MVANEDDMLYPRISQAMQEILDKYDGNKAAAARAMKTDPTSIGYWLSGNRFPSSADSIAKISNFSGHSISWLMGKSPVEEIAESTVYDDRQQVMDRIKNYPDDRVKKLLALLDLLESNG